MKRILTVFALCSLSMLPALAQTSPPVGAQDEARLRRVCDGLKLDDTQQKQMQALLSVYRAELEEAAKNPQERLKRIQTVLAEIDVAKAEGNDTRVRELQQQISQMGPETMAENNFFRNLEQSLTSEQKAQLPKLREAAKNPSPPPPVPPAPPTPPTAVTPPTPPTPPSPTAAPTSAPVPPANELRPVHVLLAALELKLSSEQRKLLENVLSDFRDSMRLDPPKDAAASTQRTDRLIQMIRPLLTTDQVPVFDKRVEALRADPPVAKPLEARRPMPPRGAAPPTPPGATPPVPPSPAPPTPPPPTPAPAPHP